MKHVIKYMSLESSKNPNDDNLIETPNLMISRTINLHVTISVFITINYVANYVSLINYDGRKKFACDLYFRPKISEISKDEFFLMKLNL